MEHTQGHQSHTESAAHDILCVLLHGDATSSHCLRDALLVVTVLADYMDLTQNQVGLGLIKGVPRGIPSVKLSKLVVTRLMVVLSPRQFPETFRGTSSNISEGDTHDPVALKESLPSCSEASP